MFVAGVMAISDFSMAPEMVADLARRCDHVVLRFDALNGDKSLFRECCEHASTFCPVHKIRSKDAWNRWNWRQQLIRALDPIKPDYVLFLDSDEKYGPGFDDDFLLFVNGGFDTMMFNYEMVTDDGRAVMKYPGAPHCKAYRWVPKISYSPYRGYARPTWPGQAKEYLAKTCKIWHYCFHTPEMERVKLNNLHK